jgi:hypothetical protein
MCLIVQVVKSLADRQRLGFTFSHKIVDTGPEGFGKFLHGLRQGLNTRMVRLSVIFCPNWESAVVWDPISVMFFERHLVCSTS